MKKAWIAAAFAAFSAISLAQVDPNRTVASVNGEPIKGAEYYHRMEYLPGVGRFMGARFAELPPGFMTLDTLITERLVLQLAKSKGVLPTDTEVNDELSHRSEENPRYLTDALANGFTKEDVQGQIRLDLAQFKIVTFGITITDQEIEEFYKKNPTKYTIPKRLKLRVIAVSAVDKEGKPLVTDSRAKVDAALASGKTFAEVAKMYSEDESKPIGGDLGLVPAELFPVETRTVINATKIGKVTAWIKQGQGWFKYLYEDAKPEEKIPLTPALRRSIRREQMLIRGSIKNNLRDEMKDVRKAAKIDITEKDFADAYKKFTEQYTGTGG